MRRIIDVTGLAVLLACAFVAAEEPIDKFMGDWKGSFSAGGNKKDVVSQVIALGGGMYEARILNSFEESGKPYITLMGKRNGDEVVFGGSFEKGSFIVTMEGGNPSVSFWAGLMDAGRFRSRQYMVKGESKMSGDEQASFTMESVQRLSPTLGKKAPANAVVLLGEETKALDSWHKKDKNEYKPAEWKLENGVMEVRGSSIMTKQEFGDFKLHLEFRTPFMPDARGQGRGNSGVYMLGRYELQVLDSYGLDGYDNECGGIYQCGRPDINMCAPPMQWQTYDIDFTTAKFENGSKVKNARVTILHNGVVIHNDRELPKPTPGGVSNEDAEKGPLYLQDHSNPVQYRNIWIQEK